MPSKSFDQFKVGDSATLKHIITEADVKKFVELTGDDNPLHVDKAFAKNTVFKNTVAHGMLGASFISTIIGKHIPGDGALWVSQNLEFLLPVRVGDELTVYACIVEKHESQRILVLDTKITNQHKQVVTKGTSKVKKLQTEEPASVDKSTSVKKVALIIGGSRGIGAATAEHLAEKGYDVAITYLKDRSSAETTLAAIEAKNVRGMICQVDVRDRVAVNEMVTKVINHFGEVSALVYSATSHVVATDFDALNWEDMQEHLDIQLQGAFHCVQRVLKELIPQQNGAVVFIGSLAADAIPMSKVTGYSISKAALHMLAKSLALEYGPVGIRFNIVSPGMTETSLIADISEKTRLLTKMQTPLRRLAQPEDIVGAIAFLLSNDAKHITGETLRIYGGKLML